MSHSNETWRVTVFRKVKGEESHGIRWVVGESFFVQAETGEQALQAVYDSEHLAIPIDTLGCRMEAVLMGGETL